MTFRFLVAAMLAMAPAAHAQSAAEHLAEGDRAYAALDAVASVRHYAAAVRADSAHAEARWKLARSAVDLAEHEPDGARAQMLLREAERHARRAIELDARDPEAHFHLARALGRMALSLGPRDRVKYATAVRGHALAALELNPRHPGALHVMGVWNAEVMRLDRPTRWIAKNLLGGRVLGSASWRAAVRYMTEAVAVEPSRIVHRLDLAEIYRDVGDKARAREEFLAVQRLPATDFNDRHYKAAAERALAALR